MPSQVKSLPEIPASRCPEHRLREPALAPDQHIIQLDCPSPPLPGYAGDRQQGSSFPCVQLASLPILPGLASEKEGDGASAISPVIKWENPRSFFPHVATQRADIKGVIILVLVKLFCSPPHLCSRLILCYFLPAGLC